MDVGHGLFILRPIKCVFKCDVLRFGFEIFKFLFWKNFCQKVVRIRVEFKLKLNIIMKLDK